MSELKRDPARPEGARAAAEVESIIMPRFAAMERPATRSAPNARISSRV
jgi:hypothetical protein